MLMRCMSNNTGTNSPLARELNVSLPTVKKMWLSIYDRVAASLPEWTAEDSPSSADSKRGKEKRRHARIDRTVEAEVDSGGRRRGLVRFCLAGDQRCKRHGNGQQAAKGDRLES